MFLVRALYRSQSTNAPHDTASPASRPPTNPAVNANKQLVELPEGDTDVDCDGFTHVQVRPMTYAEVAQMADPLAATRSGGRVDLPASLLDDDLDSDSSPISPVSASTMSVNLATMLRSSRGSHPVSVAGEDELLYGDRVLANAVVEPSTQRSGKHRRAHKRVLYDPRETRRRNARRALS